MKGSKLDKFENLNQMFCNSIASHYFDIISADFSKDGNCVLKCKRCGKIKSIRLHNFKKRLKLAGYIPFCNCGEFNNIRQKEIFDNQKFNRYEASDRFEMLDDGTGVNDKVRFKCKSCGDIQYRTIRSVCYYKAGCRNCQHINWDNMKAERENQKAVKESIKQEKKKSIQESKRKERELKIHTVMCAVCGSEFVTNISSAKYCSDKCRNHSKNMIKDFHKERSATYHTEYESGITLDKLLDRDNGICALCGKSVDTTDCYWKNNVFYVGNEYPSIDHIIPMSKGGGHKWDNVQLAHFICNSRKGNAM